MRLDGIQPRPLLRGAWTSCTSRRSSSVAGALLLLVARASSAGLVAVDEDAAPPPSAPASEAAPVPTPALPADEAARVGGSVTLRYGAREGSGNDRWSARWGLDADWGPWSAGFTATADGSLLDGAIHHEPGLGSVDLTERWIGLARDVGGTRVDLRLGTAPGVRFAQGLVLGAAAFDGLHLVVAPSPMLRVVALAGRTEVLDPEDYFVQPITLFPEDDPDLGRNGRLAAARLELGHDGFVAGLSVVDAQASGLPSAELASADVRLTKGRLSLVSEAAVRDGSGSAFYVRADVAVTEALSFGVERRRYSGFGSPLGNAPLYTGLSPGSAREEDGWRVQADFAPTARFSGSWSLDASSGDDGLGTGKPSRRLDHRLALNVALTDKTALAYGFEHETAEQGGQVHSLLVTHAWDGGARLAGRLSVDRSGDGDRTLRLSWRRPIGQRRLTLLLDDSLRVAGGRTTNTFVAGASLRVGASSQLTVRASVADGEPDSLDLTWYRRF